MNTSVRFTHGWDGTWRVWFNGRLIGLLVKYSNGAWSVRNVIPDERWDINAPIRSEHVIWAPTFQQAKAAARVHFPIYAAY